MTKFSYLICFLFLIGCSYTQKIKTGQMAYDAKQYRVAVNLLAKEYKSIGNKEDKALRAYQLARSFRAMGDYVQSAKWYQSAIDLKYGYPAYKGLAEAFKAVERYDKALDVYQEMESQFGRLPEITRDLNITKQALQWLEPDPQFEISLSDFKFNSDDGDFAPVYFEDDYIVFSSDRLISIGDEPYKWTGKDFSDIFIANRRQGEVSLFGANINTEANEATICFNKDFTEIFFTRCYAAAGPEEDQYCQIMYSEFVEDSWTFPEALSFQSTLNNYGHPALIENDSVLIFTSYSEEQGFGGSDLFYSVRGEDAWSSPLVMPGIINTQGHEKFPTANKDTLYFSSDYLPGLGGLDIFKTYLLPNGKWAPPQNLKAPFNSGSDDFGLVVDTKNRKSGVIQSGHFSSSRNYDTSDDIFAYSITRNKNVPPTKKDSVVDVPDITVYLAVKVVYKIYEDTDNPSSKLVGKEKLSDAKVIMQIDREKQEFVTDKDGRFITEIDVNKDVLLKASKEGYFNGSQNLNSKNLNTEKNSITINAEIALTRIKVNEEIVLEDIYYDFDKSDIRADAKPSLDILIGIIKDNPQLKIELGSHTDCQGNDAYNQNLSQKRAESALRYMAAQGVAMNKLRAKGYGESNRVSDCNCKDCSDGEYQSDRRTTFKIIE